MKSIIATMLLVAAMCAPALANNVEHFSFRDEREERGGDMELSLKGKAVMFSIQSTSGEHVSIVDGELKLLGNGNAVYKNADEDCILLFHFFQNGIIEVEQEGQCGAAMGVYYSGKYHQNKNH